MTGLVMIVIGIIWTWLFVDPTYEQLYHPAWQLTAISIGALLIFGGFVIGLLKVSK